MQNKAEADLVASKLYDTLGGHVGDLVEVLDFKNRKPEQSWDGALSMLLCLTLTAVAIDTLTETRRDAMVKAISGFDGTGQTLQLPEGLDKNTWQRVVVSLLRELCVGTDGKGAHDTVVNIPKFALRHKFSDSHVVQSLAVLSLLGLVRKQDESNYSRHTRIMSRAWKNMEEKGDIEARSVLAM